MPRHPEGRDEAIIVVRANCPDEANAQAIADAVISERLAAAANIHPPIESRYHWKGRIETASEVPLVLKTRTSLFEPLAERVAALHPYETSGIIAVDAMAANPSYRRWVVTETLMPSDPDS